MNFKYAKMLEDAKHEDVIELAIRERKAASVANNINKVPVRIVNVKVGMNITGLRI